MTPRDIPRERWPEFLEAFSREHRAWLAKVDSTSPEEAGPPRSRAERRLHSVTTEVEGNRVVRIEIHFQEDSQARQPVRVDAPVAVRVDETAHGTAQGLEIVDEEGGWTRLSFRVAPAPDMLDGVAPGELP